MPKNPITWWELTSTDVRKTADFFREVLARDPEETPSGHYFNVLAGGSESAFYGGGIRQAEEDQAPGVVAYLNVDDVDAKAAAVEAQGGSIVQVPAGVPGLGRVCLFTEPTGQTFGMVKRADG